VGVIDNNHFEEIESEIFADHYDLGDLDADDIDVDAINSAAA
jgi:hypothetical protein